MRSIAAVLVALAVLTGGAAAAPDAPPPVVRGTPGADRIAVAYNGVRDRVRCGAGRDVVNADPGDAVAADCEVVSRLVSRDTTSGGGGQHETQVEPHAVAAGGVIVATFQSGRRHDGGAVAIGWATSRDAGRTWRSGFLPRVTAGARPPGTAPYASDPVVAYDAARSVWLISTLAVSPGATELYISRSSDGLRWSAPVVAARSEGPSLAYDKNWAACDNWPASPFRGRCYLAYTDHTAPVPRLAVQSSDDGGLTWSEPAIAVRASQAVGVLPLARPDGTLVLVYLGRSDQQSVRSLDGGITFEQPVPIAPYGHRSVPSIRAFPLPTADVDTQGRIYAAWQDCRFRAGCSANDVVLSTSEDGTAWSAPVRVTRDSGTAFVPALSVERASGRLALAYHRCTGSPCRIDVLVSRSADRGARWSRPQLLTARPMRTAWLPTTRSGRMVGDYIGLTWSRGRPVAVYSLATQPGPRGLRQATAAVPVP